MVSECTMTCSETLRWLPNFPKSLGQRFMSIEISPSSFEFSELHQRMQFYIDEGILSCCATLIMRGTEVLDYKTYGFMDLESKRPLMDDAIYLSLIHI